jgi:hypothetical protein
MPNTTRHQTTKRAKGARAKASPSPKGRKAKASTPLITTDTLMMGGTPHLAMTGHGINQTIKGNGTHTTKVHGLAITKAKTQKARAKAVDVVGATVTFRVTITAPTLMSIRTLRVPTITRTHLLNLNHMEN